MSSRRGILTLLILYFGTFSTSTILNDIQVKGYLTSCDQDGNPITLLQDDSTHIYSTSNFSTNVDMNILINPLIQYQHITGYGAGLPQSSAYVLLKLKEYSESTYENTLKKLFDKSDGAGLNILRFPLGSCDFSMTNTSYDEYYNDYSLKYFQIDHDSQLIIELLHDILKINPNIVLIASPWSSPSWLKEWNSLLGLSEENTLLSTEEAYQTYANYFKQTYDAFRSQGLNIQYFTLQNEPLFGDNKQYPGMYFTAENEYRLGLLVKELLGDEVKLLAYDHNWDHPEYPLEILSQQSVDNKIIFDGTAWHCYGGDMATALQNVGKLYPSASQHITECTGSFPSSTCDITQGMSSFGWNHEWDMQNLFLGAAKYGSSSGTKWIMALDENCGPVLPGVEFTFGRPFVSIPLNLQSNITIDDIKWNQDYWTTAHMSKFISQNDIRVDTVINGLHSTDLLSESFYNQNTHQLTCLVMNLNHEREYVLQVTEGATTFQYAIPSWSTVVFQWIEN